MRDFIEPRARTLIPIVPHYTDHKAPLFGQGNGKSITSRSPVR